MHQHPPTSTHTAGRRLLATAGLTLIIMICEAYGSLITGSLALLADAGHMLTDLLALTVTLAALIFSRRPATARRTYGYVRLEVLAALFNSAILLLLAGSIVYEACQRWFQPTLMRPAIVMAIAAVGLLANVIGLIILGSHSTNLSVRSAFLHVLGDTLSSLGVLLGAGVVLVTGWNRVDAVISLAIAMVMALGTVRLLREVVDVLMESAPRGISTEAVRRAMAGVTGVLEVHDLHIWSISRDLPALTAHVSVSSRPDDGHTLVTLQALLRHDFGIEHSTLQLETPPIEGCGCAPQNI